jgi:hypothetical protein
MSELKERVTDEQLRQMSLVDLRLLKARIEDAIRAGIRAQKQAKAPAAPGADAAASSEPRPAPIDLERERDAWLSRR